MSDEVPTPLNDLARDLRELKPRCDLPGRDRIMFEAGRRSARGSRAWPAVSGALAATLLIAISGDPTAKEKTRRELPHTIAYDARRMVPVQPLTVNLEPLTPLPAGYLRTRNEVLRWGVDVLPAIRPTDIKATQIMTPLDARRFREDA
jgi:hypothetical protein